ncbi:ATP-grasp domain-containing protein [Paraburkholderia mimosarum]|uniref:ATP-grasp domain-containing protein n=1 Tax=Paraburkholderia mimosarum TaxID=312026 RepID=UPI00056AEECE|nr:ATP-grasp domain-containing protein [Paraburkholderia mimosarum]
MTKVLVYEYISAGGDAAAIESPALLAMGRAMRDAVTGDLARVPGVEVTSVCAAGEMAAIAARVPAPTWRVPPRGHDAVAFVREEALRHDAVWVIAPETAGVLAAMCDVVDASRWIGCDAASLRIAQSKRETARRLAQAGIATTRAWAADAPLRPGAPAWVVKPDDGAGAVRTHVYYDLGEAESAFHQRLAAQERVTLEEWVEGDALSLSLLCTQGRAELLSVNWQHIGVAQGRLTYEGVTVGAIALGSLVGHACAELAARVARALPGLAGFVGIDVVWHRERGPVVIEVNPRVTCAYAGLSERLETNLAARVLAAHHEVHLDPNTAGQQVCHAA